MHHLSGANNTLTNDTAFAIVAELSIVAFFYAMRSCEISFTPAPGRTKSIRLRGIVFRDKSNTEIPHNSPRLVQTAERVTVTFEDQKNGTKMDRRTHQRTADPILCPVKTLVSLINRIYRRIPNASGDLTLDSIRLVHRTTRVTSTMIRNYLRSTCTTLGGRTTFGFDATELGTKSLRSGAAMSLFLMNHSVHKIMILGRWSSDAFLVYIRPQVLEWTTNMSSDMIKHDSFIDASASRKNPPSDPRTRQRLFNGDRSATPVRMQPMHLHH
jgi:hypothetical protein